MTAILVLLLSMLARPAGAQEPDLVLDMGVLGSQIRFDAAAFPDSACELQPIDHCVDAPGGRRLLRFSVQADNMGTADLVLGVPPTIDPPNGGEFVYSACHMHYHFNTFARYELRQPGTSTVVTVGQKRSFCVEDTVQVSDSAPVDKRYCCNTTCGNLQGVQVGWADLYPSTLPCQWIDVTDIAPGSYDLCVILNTEGLLAENPAGDSGCVPVTITAPSTPPPRVKVRSPHAHARLKVGRHLTVAWRKRAPGEVLSRQVWFSADGGVTYRTLGSGSVPSTQKRDRFRATVTADMVTDQAKVKVFVCSKNPKDAPPTDAGAFQCGFAETKPFRVVP